MLRETPKINSHSFQVRENRVRAELSTGIVIPNITLEGSRVSQLTQILRVARGFRHATLLAERLIDEPDVTVIVLSLEGHVIVSRTLHQLGADVTTYAS